MHCERHGISAPGMSGCPDCDEEKRGEERKRLNAKLADIDWHRKNLEEAINMVRKALYSFTTPTANGPCPEPLAHQLEDAELMLKRAERSTGTWRALCASAKVTR